MAVKSLQEICEWLVGCDYADDEAFFNEPDFWQHPVMFEQTRKGDCEDHALWAWRKLVELGFEAELVRGHYFDGRNAELFEIIELCDHAIEISFGRKCSYM